MGWLNTQPVGVKTALDWLLHRPMNFDLAYKSVLLILCALVRDMMEWKGSKSYGICFNIYWHDFFTKTKQYLVVNPWYSWCRRSSWGWPRNSKQGNVKRPFLSACHLCGEGLEGAPVDAASGQGELYTRGAEQHG